jgi:hypothetical protein
VRRQHWKPDVEYVGEFADDSGRFARSARCRRYEFNSYSHADSDSDAFGCGFRVAVCD